MNILNILDCLHDLCDSSSALGYILCFDIHATNIIKSNLALHIKKNNLYKITMVAQLVAKGYLEGLKLGLTWQNLW